MFSNGVINDDEMARELSQYRKPANYKVIFVSESSHTERLVDTRFRRIFLASVLVDAAVKRATEPQPRSRRGFQSTDPHTFCNRGGGITLCSVVSHSQFLLPQCGQWSPFSTVGQMRN